MKKPLLFLLVAALLVSLAACDSKAEESNTPVSGAESVPGLNLAEWKLTASTWSSPNGATVNLTATPGSYEEGQTASFIVRLEGEDVENIPCSWDGSVYTASADLNGADGYCYYVLLTAADGTQNEVAVNTPTAIVDEALINMATSLASYCSLTVTASEQDGNKLIVTEGIASIQVPLITDEGETILCDKAVLVITLDGEEVDSAELTIGEPADAGTYNLSLSGTEFKVPAMEDDQQLQMRLDVTLSNDQILTAQGSSWIYNNGTLMLVVG